MKILQINANYGFGSTGLIMKDIGNAIIMGGYDAYFAYQKTNENIENGYQIGGIIDWKVHALLCRIFGRQGFYSKYPTRKFLKYIDKIKPDIVHLHNLHSNYINIDMLFKYLAENNVPTVITLHDCWYFTGKCFHYVDCGCNKFQNECEKCVKRKMPPRSFFVDTSKKDYYVKKRRLLNIKNLYLVGCSNWICNEVRKSFLSTSSIERIYNGVDISVFHPLIDRAEDLRKQYKIATDEFVVLGMANKWLQQDNQRLISMLLKIPSLKIILIGCSEEQIEKWKTYDDRVIAVGFIKERHELVKYYNASNVFINLTHADTLPTVNMESICCGTPVITFDTCGSPELIDDESGIIVPEGDYDCIVKEVRNIREIGRNECAEIGKRRFDKKQCYGEYISLYRRILHS